MRVLRYIPDGLLFLCTVAVLWAGLLLPPPPWILKYGLSPGCEPTGRTDGIAGVEFVEIGPGIELVGVDTAVNEPGNVPGRACRPLGLSWGRAVVDMPVYLVDMPLHWAEFPRGFWMARTVVRRGQYRRFDPAYPMWPAHGGLARPHRGPDPVPLTRSQAERYCDWISEQAGRSVRPPGPAEWYVARYAGGRPGDAAADPPLTRPGAPNAWELEDFGLYTDEWRSRPSPSALEGPEGLYLRPTFVAPDR